MELLAIIPARGGSKGIPLKNIRLLGGKPLIEYTINAAKNSKYISRTILSTEDERIISVANELGVEVMVRPKELALDETKTAPVMEYVVSKLEQQGYYPDAIVLLQPTCPTRDEVELDSAIDLFFEKLNAGYDSVFAAKIEGTTHSRWRRIPDYYKTESTVSEYECLFDYRNRPRRQDECQHYELFRETGATYIIKTDTFKKVRDFIGEKPAIYTDGVCLDIDTLDDFEKAAEIIRKRNDEKKNQLLRDE